MSYAEQKLQQLIAELKQNQPEVYEDLCRVKEKLPYRIRWEAFSHISNHDTYMVLKKFLEVTMCCTSSFRESMETIMDEL